MDFTGFGQVSEALHRINPPPSFTLTVMPNIVFRYALKIVLFSIVLTAATCVVGQSPQKELKVDFEKDVWPIFESKCASCHNDENEEAKFRVDSKQRFMQGGVSGIAINTKTPQSSLLLTRIMGKGDLDRMPLDEDPLSDKETDTIRRWIAQGAEWPANIGKQDSAIEEHWAYQKPKRPQIPNVKNNAWPQNEIDYFVLKGLDSKQLSPAERSDPAKLLRRVYLDLVGVPPDLKAIQEFRNDPSDEHYREIVDSLLASPLYGEKWAQNWLDLARYADSNGYQADQYRSVWPFRDWVINAMNRDMPFDQFTMDQLAGDLVPDATIAQKIASGFHRLTTCNVEAGVDPEENRINQVIDRVNTTGTVWLGTTIECMQCHNHKYDPFTQKEYYEIFSFFNNTSLEVKDSGNNIQYEFIGPRMDLPYSPEDEAKRKELLSQRNQIQAEIDEQDSGDSLSQWATRFTDPKKASQNWVTLLAKKIETGGSTFTIKKDRSILFGGPKPDKETYTITYATNDSSKEDFENSFGYGIKIETLTDPSLPGNGPGRHVKERPNFVLNRFAAESLDANGNTNSSIQLFSAVADFSQPNWDVSGILSDAPKTGWAINPQFGKPHTATLLFAKPLNLKNSPQIRLTLTHNYGGGRTIGRLRISLLKSKPTTDLLPKSIRKVLAKKKRSPKETKELQIFFASANPILLELQNQLASINKKIAAIKPQTTLVMVEDTMRENAIFKRGNFLDKGSKVSANTPRILHSFDKSLPQNRLGFAQWLTDKNNPLTARVTVNRWWAAFFGNGIVATQEDFGTQGELPTHPELLDWLATEFMQSNWSMKHIHRTIVSSATYQQSSKLTSTKLEADPLNRFYSRGPRFRMPAEMLRDNALKIAGLLTDRQAGPPIYPPQPNNIWRHVGRNAPKYTTSTGTDRFRRGVYVVWRRSAPYVSFVNFDAPDRASCVVARAKTNTPLQALTILNDPAYAEFAHGLSDRIVQQNLSREDSLKQAFELCTTRKPDSEELELLNKAFENYEKELRADVPRAKAIAIEQLQTIGKKTNLAELDKVEMTKRSTWFLMANVLLNLDETITKD